MPRLTVPRTVKHLHARGIRPCVLTVPGTPPGRDHAAEADVRSRGVDRLDLTGGRPVPQKVDRRAEVAAPPDNPPREALLRAMRILRRTARRSSVRAGRREEVIRPLPDVPRHVVEAGVVL